jgi:hypothetical protein
VEGWEETILKSPVEGGEEVELRMPLPAMPSSYAVAFLFAACQEIHRVGGHVLDRAVLQLFAWQLSEKVMDSGLNLKFFGVTEITVTNFLNKLGPRSMKLTLIV